MIRITGDLLFHKINGHYACEDEVKIFCKQWPDGVRVTKKNIDIAIRLGLDIDWAAEHLLSRKALKGYCKAANKAFLDDIGWGGFVKARGLAFYKAWKFMEKEKIKNAN